MNLPENMEALLRSRLEQLHADGTGTIGDWLWLRLLRCDTEKGEFLMRCETHQWMRNLQGTLHGGLCATLVDQAMGCVSYCAKPGEGIAPTVQLSITYHRPLIPEEDVLLKIRVLSLTRSLMHLSAEACEVSAPDKLCLSSTATYFYKPTN